jgi:hypothetical protein
MNRVTAAVLALASETMNLAASLAKASESTYSYSESLAAGKMKPKKRWTPHPNQTPRRRARNRPILPKAHRKTLKRRGKPRNRRVW